MEKLEEILKHKFWICFAVAVLVPTTGFFMVSGSIKESVLKRERQIKQKFSKIPKKSKIEAAANRQYIVGLTGMNANREKRIKSAALRLRNQQKVLQVWPAELRTRMKGVKYRAASVAGTRVIYKSIHKKEYERIRQILTPFNPKDGTGKIQAPLSAIPQVNDAWVTNKFSPSNRQMWDTQEDIWLLASIFEAIARVNKNADLIAKTPVRALKNVSLHGGRRVPKKKAAKSNRPQNAANAPVMPTPSASSTDARSISFKPTAVFGPETVSASGRQVTERDDDDRRGGLRMRKRRDDDEKNAAGEPTTRRYIDDEGFPFKTRGFYLEVVIEHQRLPNLLAELSNMPWPTKILKVQQGDEVSVAFAAPPAATPIRESRRNRPRFKSFGGGDPDGDEFLQGAGRNAASGKPGSRAFEAAMRDPSLSNVAIAGIMLIYKPPGEPKAGAQAKPGAAPAKPATKAPGRNPQPKSAQPSPAKAKPAAAASQPGLKKTPGSESTGSKSAAPSKSTGKPDSRKQPVAPAPKKTPATPEKATPAGGNNKGKATSEPARPTSKGKKTATTTN